MTNKWTKEILKTKLENSTFDRKSAKIRPQDLARHLIAFANTEGGIIVIGIEDNRIITGIDDYAEQINALKFVPLKLCEPSIICTFEEVPIIDDTGKDNHVLLIHIPMSGRVHATSSD